MAMPAQAAKMKSMAADPASLRRIAHRQGTTGGRRIEQGSATGELELGNLGQCLIENSLQGRPSKRPEQHHEPSRHERH